MRELTICEMYHVSGGADDDFYCPCCEGIEEENQPTRGISGVNGSAIGALVGAYAGPTGAIVGSIVGYAVIDYPDYNAIGEQYKNDVMSDVNDWNNGTGLLPAD